MAVHSVDPAALLAVVQALGPLRTRASEAEDELLGHVVTPGDAQVQAAVEAHLDQVVDVLRAVGERAAEQSLVLRTVAQRQDEVETDNLRATYALDRGERG